MHTLLIKIILVGLFEITILQSLKDFPFVWYLKKNIKDNIPTYVFI